MHKVDSRRARNRFYYDTPSEEVLRNRESRRLASLNQIPWSRDELTFAYNLSLNPDYLHPSGRGMVSNKPDYYKIALAVNRRFHNQNKVRTSVAVRRRISRERK